MNNNATYKYIDMQWIGGSPSGKTAIWQVRNSAGHGILGEVKWYGSWRQYCFFPNGSCVFSAGCLDDIRCFIHRQMNERKDTARKGN